MLVRVAVAVSCVLSVATFALVRTERDTPARPTHPAHVLLGAYVSADGRQWARGGVTALEGAIGRPLAIDHRFKHWNDPFPTTADDWDHTHGRLPMITWEPDTTSLAAIVSGADDARLRDTRGRRRARRPTAAAPLRPRDERRLVPVGRRACEHAGNP